MTQQELDEYVGAVSTSIAFVVTGALANLKANGASPQDCTNVIISAFKEQTIELFQRTSVANKAKLEALALELNKDYQKYVDIVINS